MRISSQLLSEIWNWLPAFRAVAEAEHLPTASRELHVSISALSRTIRLLEEHVGRQLFNRSGRNLVLNTAGEQLLAAVQEGMQSVGIGLRNLAAEELAGPVRIATLGVLTNHYVLPAVLDLREAHGALVPRMINHRASEANELLARGSLDVAFYYDALSHEALRIERMGVSTNSVYCGPGHPLFDAPDPSLEEILAHPFSVPEVGDKGGSMDNWPVDVPRRVGMQISLLLTNLEVCRSGKLLTVLPDVVALPDFRAAALRRLPFERVAPTDLFVAYRRNESPTGGTAALIRRVRQRVAEVDDAVETTIRKEPRRTRRERPPHPDAKG